MTTGSDPGRARAFADAPGRLVAYLVDAVFLSCLSFVGAVVISLLFGPAVTIDLGGDPQVVVDRGLALANAALGTVISVVYFVGCWRAFGGSLGQRLLRLRIEGSGTAERVPVKRWLIRWAFIGLPIAIEGFLTPFVAGSVIVLVVLAGVIWYAFLTASIARSATKQGWHDRVARTVVIRMVRLVPEPDVLEQEPEPRVR